MTEREYIERRIDDGDLCAFCEKGFAINEEKRDVFCFKLHVSCEREYRRFTSDGGETVVQMSNDAARRIA